MPDYVWILMFNWDIWEMKEQATAVLEAEIIKVDKS